jgi:mannose-6-phosphate isomerase-like protein (cupin superfamily)
MRTLAFAALLLASPATVAQSSATDVFAKIYGPGVRALEAWHITDGPDGESHVERIELAAGEHDFFGVPKGLKQYVKEKPDSFHIFSVPGNIELPWHTTDRKEMFIILRGTATMLLGGGTKKEFGPGSIVIFEDNAGRGHAGRTGPEGYTVINMDLGPIENGK